MALIQANFVSQSLMRTVTVHIILPVDKFAFPGSEQEEIKEFPTLYLLHGILGNYTDWVSGTCIQRWAEEKNLAVVMPSGENGFYVDQEEEHRNYGEYIGKELVEITRKMFPLSAKKSDTFIGGLSMGGYGALRNGLKYHGTFGCIAAFSSALILDGIEKRTNSHPLFAERRDYAERIFGDLEKVKGSDMDPAWLASQLKEAGQELPKIYMACGKDDSLLGANRKMRDFLRSLGADLTYEETPGGHEWDFWNAQVKKAVDWLPLDGNAHSGINSGNVGI